MEEELPEGQRKLIDEFWKKWQPTDNPCDEMKKDADEIIKYGREECQ